VRAVPILLVAVCVPIVLACSACKKGGKGTDAGVASSASSSASSAGGPSSTEQAWIDARGGDPLELARLANRLGAHALAEVGDDDKASEDDRATAFRALAFLDDPSPALPALTRAATGTSLERSTLALQTLAAIAPRRRPIEEVEPGAWRTTAEGILQALLSPNGIKDPVRRELGIRTLIGLSERGAIKRELVPVN